MLAGLTLLPALLTIFGRARLLAAPAPRRLRPRATRLERAGVWRRVGDRVARSAPAPGARLTTVHLRRRRARPARLQGRLLDDDVLQEEGRERRGLQGHREGVPGRLARPDDACSCSARTGRCARPTSRRSPSGSTGVPDVGERDADRPSVRATAARPRSTWSSKTTRTPKARSTWCPRCATRRRTSRRASTVLVGGGSAIQYDFDEATEQRPQADRPAGAARDRRSSSAILLRAIVAPLVLIATRGALVLRRRSGSRSCSSATSSATPASTPRCPPSRSSSSWRSGSTTRSS